MCVGCGDGEGDNNQWKCWEGMNQNDMEEERRNMKEEGGGKE